MRRPDARDDADDTDDTDAIGIIGVGHAVPATVRRNDDPLFADRPESADEALFSGFCARRVLAAGESLAALAVLAARAALADAGVEVDAIDRLIGAVSPSQHLAPSDLFAVHAALGLSRACAVVPIQADHANFVAALTCAWEAIAAGRCALVLVVVASGWSRLVDYADPGALGIGDGAGAVVVGRRAGLRFVDERSDTYSALHDAMTVQLRTPRRPAPGQGEGCQPTFVFGASGSRVYRELAVAAPLRLFTELLARHGLAAGEVALFIHQPSRAAIDAWCAQLGPGELPSELETLGNCTLATAAILLALHARRVRSRYLVVMTFGYGQIFSAMLLLRRV